LAQIARFSAIASVDIVGAKISTIVVRMCEAVSSSAAKIFDLGKLRGEQQSEPICEKAAQE